MSAYLSEAAVQLDRQRQELQDELDRVKRKLQAVTALLKGFIVTTCLIEDRVVKSYRKAAEKVLEALDD